MIESKGITRDIVLNNCCVRFVLSNHCIFDCSYCKEHDGNSKIEIKDVNTILDNIVKISKIKNRKICLDLIGGEVLLDQQLLIKIFEYIKSNKEHFSKIIMFTNLGLKIENEILSYIKELDVDIGTSYHPEFTPNNKFFKSNFELLRPNIGEFNIMCRNISDLPLAQKIQKEFNFGGIVFDYRDVFKNKEQYNILSKLEGFSYLKNWTTKTKNNKCIINKVQTVVGPDGFYYECYSDTFNNYKTNIDFKKILDNDTLNEISNKTIICKYDNCYCEEEIVDYIIKTN